MDYCYFDASALAKRYSQEPGTDAVNHLFDTVPIPRRMCLTVGALEVVSILVRKRNDGRMTLALAHQAIVNLDDETFDNPDWSMVAVDNRVVTNSAGLILKHSINSVDAIVLTTALEIDTDLRIQGDRLILVSADRRLNRAADAEGLAVFNPETDAWDD